MRPPRSGDDPERTLSPVGNRFHPGFQNVLRAIRRTAGFVLLPVEVPGPDLGRALAEWLTAAGCHCSIVEPVRDSDWEGLAASIRDANAPSPDGALMVIGNASITDPMQRGLRAVNHQRDSIVAAVGRPLLWCGPPAFLDATWEVAPDFWSVRGMRIQLKTALSVGELPAEYFPLPSKANLEQREQLQKLMDEATAQGDRLNAARVASRLAPLLPPVEAAILADKSLATLTESDDRGLRGSLHTVRAQAAVRSEDWARALREFRIARDLADSQEIKAGLALSISITHSHLGRMRASFVALQEAVDLSLGTGSHVEADAQVALAQIEARRGKGEESLQHFEKALHISERLGDKRSQAEILLEMTSVISAMQDAPRALKTGSRGLAIAEQIGDHRLVTRALLAMGASHGLLKHPRESESFVERALASARRSGDANLLQHVESIRTKMAATRKVGPSGPASKRRPK